MNRINLLLVTVTAFFVLGACNNKIYPIAPNELGTLEGTWELNYVSAPGSNPDSLYRDKKPFISFNTSDSKVTGNTGCNNFSGTFTGTPAQKISFSEAMISTRMACPGSGEQLFFSTLKKVNAYTITDGSTLNLIMGDIAVMRFTKKI